MLLTTLFVDSPKNVKGQDWCTFRGLGFGLTMWVIIAHFPENLPKEIL